MFISSTTSPTPTLVPIFLFFSSSAREIPRVSQSHRVKARANIVFNFLSFVRRFLTVVDSCIRRKIWRSSFHPLSVTVHEFRKFRQIEWNGKSVGAFKRQKYQSETIFFYQFLRTPQRCSVMYRYRNEDWEHFFFEKYTLVGLFKYLNSFIKWNLR